MVVEDIVPGQYSPLGRKTERSLRRLKTQVAADEEPSSPTESPKHEESSPVNMDRFRLPQSKWRHNKPSSSTALGATMSTTAGSNGFGATLGSTFSRASTMDLSTASNDRDAAGDSPGDLDTTATSSALRASAAFSALGQDSAKLCELSRAKHGRFLHPSRDSAPEAGHYRINDSCSFRRPPMWDLSRASEGRPVATPSSGMELGEMYNGFSDGLAQRGKFEPMALAPKRPDVTSLCQRDMTFAPEHQKKEWAKLDAFSSRSERYPDWDFKKHMQGHHFDIRMSFPYFEPGKYNAELKSPSPVGLPFSKVRAQSAGEMKTGDLGPKNRLLPERTRFRGCAAVVPRKTCVQDFAQDLDRPPLLVLEAAPYDEDDPEVSQKVLDWQMSFDASTADKMIVARCSTPSMKASLARDQALRGARILSCDPGLQRSMGIGTVNVDSKTGDELHDEWRWHRADTGLAFSQMSGRYGRGPPTLTSRVHSSLRRPKSEVTFSFKRSACKGFSTGASVQKILNAASLVTDDAMSEG